MGGLWTRLRGLLPSRPRPVPLAERFAHFRAIGAANDDFLRSLAEMQAAFERPVRPGLAAATMAYERLSAPVGAMARSLVAMTGGRHAGVVRRYEALDRELSHEVLKERPIEFGPLILWPGDPDAVRPELVGPKAARLAEVSSMLGAAVPPFFVVTVHGFRLFMEATGVEDRLHDALCSTDLADDGALRELCGKARGLIEDACVPPVLAGALRGAFFRLCAQCEGLTGVAVRSSAVVEDAESSFAGQFESVLNVVEEGLDQAFVRVLASKYRPEAMRYARCRGIGDEDVAMPVLVMAMVDAQAAGVAYSRAPERSSCAMVSAVRGLAAPLVDGRAVPDVFFVSERRRAVDEHRRSFHGPALVCGAEGRLVVEQAGDEPPIDGDTALGVARAAWSLERHFGQPQDVEWALDRRGSLRIVQTRPLIGGAAPAPPRTVAGYRVLIRGAAIAAGGVASGPVVRVGDDGLVEQVPEGAVLVVPTTSPRLAGVIGSVAAVVAARGSATGHLATVAREFGTPCLVAEVAPVVLTDGMTVTVDADAGVVYEGRAEELLGGRPPRPAAARPDPARALLERLIERVAPLTLTDPEAPAFCPEGCRTLHDMARLVHHSAMGEMFVLGLSPRDRHAARRLSWSVPMEVLLVDLGGGLIEAAPKMVGTESVASEPLLALIEGMTDSRLRWSGPVGFDLKGFMSLVVRSAADDQRYGEPSYAVFSREFVHFASRLAYHFATVEAMCTSAVNENYVRFLFHGGAAVAERREWRARFLALVLHYNGFAVRHVGDRVEALLTKRFAPEVEEALVMIGRLMVASRHLDMVMQNGAAAEALAQAFLAGDFAFDRVRSPGP